MQPERTIAAMLRQIGSLSCKGTVIRDLRWFIARYSKEYLGRVFIPVKYGLNGKPLGGVSGVVEETGEVGD